MARGERSEHNEARIVSMQQWKMRNHPASGGLKKGASRIKKAIVGPPANPDLDDPNTPEYTGQEARISDLAPRNIRDVMKGGTGQVPKKSMFSWDENNNPSFRGKPIK
jgi:hypothetical protein